MTATLNTLPEDVRSQAFSVWDSEALGTDDDSAELYQAFPAHWSPRRTPVDVTYIKLVALGWSAAQEAFAVPASRFPAKLLTETAIFLKSNGDNPVVEEVTLIGWNAAVKAHTI